MDPFTLQKITPNEQQNRYPIITYDTTTTQKSGVHKNFPEEIKALKFNFTDKKQLSFLPPPKLKFAANKF